MASNTEWLNQNSTRAFPLGENSPRLDVTGNVKLPDSLIVAAQINADSAYGVGVFFISKLLVSTNVVSIGIGYVGSDNQSRDIAIVGIDIKKHIENTSYVFSGKDEDSSVIGTLTIGNLFETQNSVPGLVTFSSESTYFEVSALFISVPAFEAIEVWEGGSLIKRFNNVLKLRAGSNIRLSYVGNDTIRVDAISGENLTDPGQCANATPILAPIRSINGIGADENRNFNFDGSDCIDISSGANGIIITDLCSTSCCGCNELESLVTSLKTMEAQISGLGVQISSTVASQSALIAQLLTNI